MPLAAPEPAKFAATGVMVLKCYPCIRGCSYVKGALGGVLLLLTVYMFANQPEGRNCGEMLNECILDFGVLIDQMANQANFHLTRMNEVQKYCNCFVSCVNYISVFHANGMAVDSQNCFRKTAKAGLPGVATTGLANGTAMAIWPSVSMTTCSTCSEVVEAQSDFSTYLAALASLCGLAMLVTAGCEHMEIKFHNAAFSFGVLFLDFICGFLLAAAMVLSISGAQVALQGCNPESFDSALKQGGIDSVAGDKNKAAIFTDFLALMLEPLGEGICEQLRPLSVFALVAAVSGFSNFWSAMSTLCLCMGCTDDGIDDLSDDEKALDLHALMTFN